MIHHLEFRKVERPCYCRVCNKQFPRNSDKLIRFYSMARKGGIDIICKDCVALMSELIKEDK